MTNTHCRITMHSPNKAANKLYKEVLKQCFDEKSFFGKYWPLLIFGIIGFVFAIIVLVAGGSDGMPNFKGGFFVFLFFFAIGVLIQWANRIDSTKVVDKDGINKARSLLDEKLEIRTEQAIRKHKPSILNTYTLSPPPDASPDGFPVGQVLPYADMNQAGCIPSVLIVTYEQLWAALAAQYEHVADANPNAKIILDLHQRWVDFLAQSINMAKSITCALNNQRARANKIAMRNAMGSALDAGTGAIGGLAGIASEGGALSDIAKSLKDIKGSLQDINQLHQSSPSGFDSDSEEPRSGIHPIMRPVLIFQYVFVSVIFISIIIVSILYEEDGPVGAWVCGIALVLSYPLFWYLARGKNQALNALEDVAKVELLFRSCIGSETTKAAPPMPGSEGLVAATNALRNQIMEAYYDTLGIHCQTGLLSFGEAPENKMMAFGFYWSERQSAPNTVIGSAVSEPFGSTTNAIIDPDIPVVFDEAVYADEELGLAKKVCCL